MRAAVMGLLGIGVLLIEPAGISSAHARSGPVRSQESNPCISDFSNVYLNGVATAANSLNYDEGATANMTYQYGDLCSGTYPDRNTYSAWDAVSNYNGGFAGYAQSDELYYVSLGCLRHFAEQTQNQYSDFVRVTGTCVGAGEVHKAWQQYLPENGHTRSNIDLTIFIESPWSPYGSWAFPFFLQFAGEVHDPNSLVPGSAGTPVQFAGMEAQFYTNDQWYSTCDSGIIWRYSGPQAPGGIVSLPNCNTMTCWYSG